MLEEEKPHKQYDIDFVGTGTQITLHNVLQRRNLEPIKRPEAILSARGLKHRTPEYFMRDINNSTNYIQNQLRVGKRDSAARSYKGSQLFNVYFQRAIGYEKLGLLDKALADYNSCIELDDSYAPSFFNRSAILSNRGDLEGALKDLARAVKLDPSNADYHRNRSLLLRRTGEYKEAIKETVVCKTLHVTQSHSLSNEFLDQTENWKVYSDPVLSILEIPGCERTNVQELCNFLKGLKFFQGFAHEADILDRLSRRLELERFQKGEYIFEEGSVGDKFYVVFDGEVSIVKSKKNSNGEVIGSNTLVKIFRGHAFGDTALDAKDGIRSASAVASQKCVLMSLNIDDYKNIVAQFKTLLRNEICRVLQNSAAFATWDLDKIEVLASAAIIQNFGANQLILNAGAPVKNLFIIKHGVANLIKTIPHPLRNSGAPKAEYSASGAELPGLWILDKNWKDRMNTFDKSEEEDIVSNAVSEESLSLTVGILGSGQVFGELAILDPDKPSPVAVHSCTNMEIYCFDSDVLISLGARFNGCTINALNESMNMCNPPGEKVAYYYRSKFDWERRKIRLLHQLGHKKTGKKEKNNLPTVRK